MKFLCLPCDRVMEFSERQLPGDGTMAAVFACPGCAREMAMLTNPMETRLVSGLGVKVGGRSLPEQPLELVRGSLASGGADALVEQEAPLEQHAPPDGEAPLEQDARLERVAPASPAAPAEETAVAPQSVRWSPDALERLERVPSFVRGMVKRIYADWARGERVELITPAVMDRARSELGLEGM